MNKQELAAKIWASTNTLRGNIELGTYKDYMLSLLFYKFLSDKEEYYLYNQGWTKEDIKLINEEDAETVIDCQKNIGYFISYEDLFSTWVAAKNDFNVKNVIDGLNAFDRLIGTSHKRVFSKIFETLQSNISNLGSTAADQTKALRALIETINDIPSDSSEGYDVLGFIYEFLIGNFAANAGKKAGEFYTPHEVSVLMSEIVSNHLKDRENIKILDPTSGSGSLLITIGKAFEKYSGRTDNVEYYAQEWIKSTYNLTRMNLVMKGILPNNIHVRNGDTLAKDWPYFDDRDPENTYFPVPVDAVVSNPPYSQKWDPKNRDGDPRFSGYGIAPKGKADMAFLLYDLYHVAPNGIATVVLPHGVLFRGGEEKTIRQQLIENNKIDAIIGLPVNAFYGTGIPTILMVLKQNRDNTDVLIIDASKGFIKAAKKNKLQAKNIKKIADTYIGRLEEPKYSRRISKAEIVENDYNLNIPRYVDSSDPEENWDLYSLMRGGIPNYEIEEMKELWVAFPSLQADLFSPINDAYSNAKAQENTELLYSNADVQRFLDKYRQAFENFGDYLKEELISDPLSVPILKEEDKITEEIIQRYNGIPLVDHYHAYQILDDLFTQISTDLELMQAEGFEAVQIVDPNMVTKKEDDKTIEVQKGWKGHILPFDLVQQTFFPETVLEIQNMEKSLVQTDSDLEELIGSFTEEELSTASFIDNDNDNAFIAKEVPNAVIEILADVSTPEIETLKDYLCLLDSGAKKVDKNTFVSQHENVCWNNITASRDGTYSKTNTKKYLGILQQEYVFEETSYEAKVLSISSLLQQQKDLKKQLKDMSGELEEKTIVFIQKISEEDARIILEKKWILPLTSAIEAAPQEALKAYIAKINYLCGKYTQTTDEVETEIKSTENELLSLMSDLTGSEYDLAGLTDLEKLLGGDDYE